jgi:hypothetical protein
LVVGEMLEVETVVPAVAELPTARLRSVMAGGLLDAVTEICEGAESCVPSDATAVNV